jgi:hypothetical protein
MPDGVSQPPKRPKLSLRGKPADRPGAEPSVDAQAAIPLGYKASAPEPPPAVEPPQPPPAPEPPGAQPVAPEVSTLIGAADYAAHDALAPGDPELVRRKLDSSGSEELKRKGFFSDTPDKWLFVVFTVLGFGGIFTAKLMAYSGLLVAIAAVGLLIGYAVTASRTDAFRSNPDRLGDNCYYMGFLFTLASLSAALVALQRDTETGRGDLLESLISGFGIALFSTIAGITLRVFFMQMRREIEDLEEELRTELQRSAGLLKHQLGLAVIDLESFRLRTQQVMSQQMDGAASEFAGLAEKLITYVADAGSAYGNASKHMAANADRVATDISRLADRVEKIEVPSDLLTRQVDDARGRIEALATALEAAVDAGGRRQSALEQSSQALDILLLRLTDVTVFNQIEQSANRFAAAVEATGDKVAAVGDHLGAYAASIGGIAAQVEKDGQAVSRARGLIDQDLEQSTAALHKLQGTLADVADGLVARVAAPATLHEGGARPGES